MDSVDTFKRYVSHPDLTAREVADLYLNVAGESPTAIAEMTVMLSDDVVQVVDAHLAKAPISESKWQDFVVAMAECDTIELTRRFRLGVEAVRRFRRTNAHKSAE